MRSSTFDISNLPEKHRWIMQEMASESKSIIQEITKQDEEEFETFLDVFIDPNKDYVSKNLFSWLDENKLHPNKLFQLLKKHRAAWNEKAIPTVEALVILFDWTHENIKLDIAPVREVIQCCGPIVCDIVTRSRNEKLIKIFVENGASIDRFDLIVEELKNKESSKEKQNNLLDELILLLDDFVLKDSKAIIKNNKFLNKFIFLKGESALTNEDIEVVEKLINRVNEIIQNNKSGSLSREFVDLKKRLNDTLENMMTLLKAMRSELQDNLSGARAYYTELALQDKRIARLKMKDLSIQESDSKAAEKWSKEECVFTDTPESYHQLELKAVQTLETKAYPADHVDKMLKSCAEKSISKEDRVTFVESLVALDLNKLTSKDADNIKCFLSKLQDPSIPELILRLEFARKLYDTQKFDFAKISNALLDSLRLLFWDLKSSYGFIDGFVFTASNRLSDKVKHFSQIGMNAVLDDKKADESLKAAMCKIISLMPGGLDHVIGLVSDSDHSRDAQRFLRLASEKYHNVFPKAEISKIRSALPDIKTLMLCEVQNLYGKIKPFKSVLGMFAEDKTAAKDLNAAVSKLFEAIMELPSSIDEVQQDKVVDLRKQVSSLTQDASVAPEGVITDVSFFQSLGEMTTLIKDYFPQPSSPTVGIKKP